MRAAWSFQAAQDSCVALARAGSASLRILISADGMIRLTLTMPGQSGATPVARFNGPAGNWLMKGALLPSRQSALLATFSLPRNDTSLSRILMLLSGGMLELGPADAGLPILALPESGDDGRQWFICARRSVTGT